MLLATYLIMDVYVIVVAAFVTVTVVALAALCHYVDHLHVLIDFRQN